MLRRVNEIMRLLRMRCHNLIKDRLSLIKILDFVQNKKEYIQGTKRVNDINREILEVIKQIRALDTLKIWIMEEMLE